MNTGGSAFPHIGIGTDVDGMTLRDYFAAKALLVVMPSVVEELQRRNHSSEKTAMLKKVAAEACYGMADALLEARDGSS